MPSLLNFLPEECEFYPPIPSIYPSIPLSIHLVNNPFICLAIQPTNHPSMHSIHTSPIHNLLISSFTCSIPQSVHPLIYHKSIHSFTELSIHVSISPSIGSSNQPPTHPFTYLSINPLNPPSLHLSTNSSIYLSFHPSTEVKYPSTLPYCPASQTCFHLSSYFCSTSTYKSPHLCLLIHPKTF